MKTTLNITSLWSVLALSLMFLCAEATYHFAARPENEPRFFTTGGQAASSRRFPSPLAAGALPAMQQVQQKPNIHPSSSNVPDVSVTCSGSDLVLRVRPTFYGLLADKEELKLGDNCGSNGVLRPYGDMLFTYPLTACGAVRQSAPHHVAYKFVLHYKPLDGSLPKVDVDIECRYPRNYHVSKLIVQPTWRTAVMHKRLKGLSKNFHIELMDESWSKPVSSRVYQLGSQIHFQISAFYLPHGAKTYISSCFAAPANDPGSSQKYIFIDNSGCLLDSKRAPTVSQFISQTDNTVRFSLTAFQFVDEPEVALKVQCQLLVTPEDPGPAHKSCTYRGNRWEALSGDDSICKCCDSQCVISKQRRALIEGSATSQLLMVSDQPSMKEEDVSAIISTSSSMTSDGGSALSHYIDDLQSHDNRGWTTVDLHKEVQHGRYIRSNLDPDQHGYMGKLPVDNVKSVTKAVLFKGTESGSSFDDISKGEIEDLGRIEDGNYDVSQPKQFQTRNKTKKSLTEINQLKEQRDSKEAKESREHEEKQGNGIKLNSEVQLGSDKELGRNGVMTWYFW